MYLSNHFAIRKRDRKYIQDGLAMKKKSRYSIVILSLFITIDIFLFIRYKWYYQKINASRNFRNLTVDFQIEISEHRFFFFSQEFAQKKGHFFRV